MNKIPSTKYEIQTCVFTEEVECRPEHRVCKRCGFNPIVAEIRITAIKQGEKKFLRYTEEDFDKICLPLRKIK